MTLNNKLDQAIADRRDDALELLRDLVRQQSTLGQVRSAQDVLARACRQSGLDTHLYDLDLEHICTHPDFAPTDWSFAGQPNLSAVLPATGSGGRSLVLNGHIDVVSAEPVDWWSFDPWGGEIREGRLYGRGGLDMKGGLVAALLAIQAVRESGIGLRAPVIFESVIEEECSGNGMLANRLRTGPVDGLVIMEPTNETTWIATPGVLWFDLLIRGRSGYVGRTGGPVNAVETAAAFITRLKPRVVDALNAAFRHPAFTEAGMDRPLTLNTGIISGGDWPSLVPLECRVSCRMSFPIAWSFAQARAFVEEQIRVVANDDSWLAELPPVVRFRGFRARGWEARLDGTLLATVEASHQTESGSRLERTVFPGTADARYVDAAAGEQAVYYGPTGGNIHAPDEWVEIASVERVARVLARLIVEWCGTC